MFGTYQRLGVHVYASNLEVIRAARKKLTRKAQRDLSYRTARKDFYRIMLRYHQEARQLVAEFAL